MAVYFGREEEWKYFAEEHEALLEALTGEHKACIELLKAVQMKRKSQEDTVILALGMACLKEFEEIILLCGNGYGSGANKILGAFFERVIALGYLAKHPDKIQQFIDYTNVHWQKLLIEAREKHEDVGLSAEEIAHVEEEFANVKERYMVDACRKCGTHRLQGSWTKKPIPSMAEDLDGDMRKLYFNAFLRPTFLIHTTFFGVMAGAEKTEHERLLLFSQEKERLRAKETIDLAHILVIQAAITLNVFYNLEADSVLEGLGKELDRLNGK
jgi:hypothetical protein